MRLTLDWDNISKKEMVKRLELVKNFFPFNDIEVYLSASGKGFHVIVYNASNDFDEILFFRRIFGDDLKRVKYDEIKHKISKLVPTQILFDKKKGKYAKLIYKRSLKDKVRFYIKSIFPKLFA